MSFATITPANMELTPMRVMWKPPGETDFIDLGGTLDNVVLTPAYKKSPIRADQLGTTDIDDRVSGIDIKVTTSLAEVLLKDNWKVVFPHATIVPGTGGFAGKSALDFNSAIGDNSSIDNAGELLLHPLSKADSDKDSDYIFYKACATAESEIVYSPEGQAKLKVVWKIYPDLTDNPPKFFRFGDADLV